MIPRMPWGAGQIGQRPTHLPKPVPPVRHRFEDAGRQGFPLPAKTKESGRGYLRRNFRRDSHSADVSARQPSVETLSGTEDTSMLVMLPPANPRPGL